MQDCKLCIPTCSAFDIVHVSPIYKNNHTLQNHISILPPWHMGLEAKLFCCYFRKTKFLHIVTLNMPPVLQVCCFPSEGQQVTEWLCSDISWPDSPEQCQRFLFQGGEGPMWIESSISHREEVGCH